MTDVCLVDQSPSVVLTQAGGTDAYLFDQPSTVVMAQDDGTVVVLVYAGPAGAQGNASMVPGPRGQAAGQDIGWMLSGGVNAGEVLNTPPLPHAQTWDTIYAHSDSGFAGNQTLTIRQKRANVVIATATLAVGPGAHDWSATITPLVGEVADVATLVTPDPADSQCTDLSVSLGSTP